MINIKHIVYKINSDTYMIREKFIANQLCYLLCGQDKALLIDTGFGNETIKETVRTVTNLPVIVANTHAHFDHIGGNHLFDELWLHEDDRDVFKLYADPTYTVTLLHEIPLPLRMIFGRLIRQMLEVDPSGNYHYFRDGHVFQLGGRDVEVIHTPGHSSGSVCFLDREERMLFSGDTVCERGVLLHLEGSCSPEIYLESVRRLKKLSPDFETIYPGHHGFPIHKEYIDEYINCAQQIVDGTAKMKKDKGHLYHKEGRVRITVQKR